MNKIITSISILLLALNVAAGEFYVATDGSDSSNGLTETTAWKTINYALATVPAGNAGNPALIHVAAGAYDGESDGTYWKLNFRGKDFVHLVGAGAGNTILTHGSKTWEMNGGTGIVDMNGTTGSRFEGFRIIMDAYPTPWDANVIRIADPNGVVVRDIWVDGPYTVPADRCGRRIAIYGTAGANGLSIEKSCFSGGGLAFWLGVTGAGMTIDVSHVTIADYATSRTDDNNGFFDQRSQPNTTPVHVHDSIFKSLTVGINAGTPTNSFGFNYMVNSNILYDVDTWFNHNVQATNANVSLRPHFVTLADGRGYVTTNTDKGWFYSTGTTGAPPVITFPVDGQDILGTAGSSLWFTVKATDPDTPPEELVFWAVGTPAGSYFNPTNQVFSWLNPPAGVYPGVTFYVSDGEKASSSDVTIFILGGPILSYYVRTNGVDSAARTGLSVEQSWKTINYSLGRVQPGNKYEHTRLDIGPGLYDSERSGLHGKPDNWHINIDNLSFVDIIGAGPDKTHLTRGTGTSWELSEIIRLFACDGVSFRGMRLTVENPTSSFISAGIRLENCNNILLDNLWLTGTKNIGTLVVGSVTNVFRNGSGIGVFGTTGTDGITVQHVLVDGFGRAFYTEARGGYHATNFVQYCTFVEQDGSFDIDDGVSIWTRANGISIAYNHIHIQRCIFSRLPASVTNFGLGMRCDATGNWNLYGDPILFSEENNFYDIGDNSTGFWFSPNLIEFEASTNDISIDPEFYTDPNGLPFISDSEYGWNPIPEPGAIMLAMMAVLLFKRT